MCELESISSWDYLVLLLFADFVLFGDLVLFGGLVFLCHLLTFIPSHRI